MTNQAALTDLATLATALDDTQLTPELERAGRDIANGIRTGLDTKGIPITADIVIAIVMGAGLQATLAHHETIAAARRLAAAIGTPAMPAGAENTEVPAHGAVALACAYLARDILQGT